LEKHICRADTKKTFNGEVANTIKSLPYVKDVVPGYTAQVQLNVEANIDIMSRSSGRET